MKREGRQHGMVRTYPIMSQNFVQNLENSSSLNKLTCPPTAGLFTKVSPKPTNHSKFSGKCGRSKCTSCHIHAPCNKSKDKAKGSKKLRSHDFVSNYKLITLGVVDSGFGFKFSGVSATGILDLLGNDYYGDNYDDIIYDSEDDDGFEGANDHVNILHARVNEIEEINNKDVGIVLDDDDDDVMSFCDVDLEEMDEDWCLVEE